MEHSGHESALAAREPSSTSSGPPPGSRAGDHDHGNHSRHVERVDAPGQLIGEPRHNGASRRPSRRDHAPLVKPAEPARSKAKRCLDLALTIAVLPLALVAGTVIAVLVASTSRGSVFFLQERVGLGGRSFRMVKFRTMLPDAEQVLREDPDLWSTYVDNDFKLPTVSDPRLTTVGRWLRRWSLDELPQVLNVLTGSMSWVGPRPVTPDQLEDWGPDSEAYLSLRPGITGWWQINGRSDIQSMDRIAYDGDYLESWNFWLDVRILARTPLKVFHGKGAF
jgi:exopolysaccharide production protein ExoY